MADKVDLEMVRAIKRLEAGQRRQRVPANTVTPARPHPQLIEEFAGGTATSGQVGEMGWTHAGGSITALAGEVGHLGIYRLSTGTAAGTRASLHAGADTATGILSVAPGPTDQPPDFWTVRFVFRPSLALDNQTLIRVGLALSPQAGPPNHGCYLEKLAADTTFFALCRASGSSTRSQILTLAGAAMTAVTLDRWYRLRIRRLAVAAIGFTVEEVAIVTAAGHDEFVVTPYPEVTITGNIPTTASGLQLFAQIHNGAAASARGIDLDFCELQLSNLAR